uniref:Protein kinase domain-containing protein n=1 Tax=Hucho hucho TaxID=62062 RepID=A0A4W5LE16_9TELE
ALRTGQRDVKGTIGFMAPEVCVGGKYGAAADVYSLGVLLVELCTLDRPFPELTKAIDVYLAVVNERRRPELPRDIAPWLQRLTEACLSHDPRDRPSATEIATCLVEHLLDATSVEPTVDAEPEPAQEPEPTVKGAVEAAPVDRPLEVP